MRALVTSKGHGHHPEELRNQLGIEPGATKRNASRYGISTSKEDDSDNPSDIFVKIKWRDLELGVPQAQLEGIEVSKQTAEVIADWHYWCAHGYC